MKLAQAEQLAARIIETMRAFCERAEQETT